jgi:hypothetical protein
MREILKLSLLLIFIASAQSCAPSNDSDSKESGDGDGNGAGGVNVSSRSFYMGFTPWPYDLTLEAVSWVYSNIMGKGDIVSHHMDEGVPWVEFAADLEPHINFVNEVNGRVLKTPANKKVLLSINPTNVDRSGLSDYRGSDTNMSLPSPWDGYAFNSTEVKSSFLKYAKWMIGKFNPDYLLIGIEVNILAHNSPGEWDDYLELHQYIYAELKKLYPNLLIGISVFSPPILGHTDENQADQISALNDVLPHVDFLGVSIHPFMSVYLAEQVPPGMFDAIRSWTTKPIAITESSYPGEAFQMDLGPIQLDFNGSEVKQDQFLMEMLSKSEEHGFLFVIWFSIRDYDALWSKTGSDNRSLIWRDTGLIDESGSSRSALDTWEQYFKAPIP